MKTVHFVDFLLIHHRQHIYATRLYSSFTGKHVHFEAFKVIHNTEKCSPFYNNNPSANMVFLKESQPWASEWRDRRSFSFALDFEIWYFPIKFSAKTLLSWFRVDKMKFHHCFPPWKNPFGYPLKNPLLSFWKKNIPMPMVSTLLFELFQDHK